MPNWRYWLIDAPNAITDTVGAWYRLYWLVVVIVAGPGLVLMVLTMLVLWYGFGIRWGW